MSQLLALFLLFVTTSSLPKDDSRWIWGDNTKARQNFDSRYEVFEPSYRPDFAPIERPGGVYGNHPTHHNYGNGHLNHEESAILTGPVPSWVKQGPIKNIDKCKCTEKFNCPSSGISYGHCDVGKQYCCYSAKHIGGPIPSRPVHSPEHGVLVGPGGPIDGGVGAHRPRPGGFGLGGGRGDVLIGPGGHYGGVGGRPSGGGYGLYARAAKNSD